MEAWAKPLEGQITVYLLELPFHGESKAGAEGEILANSAWKAWFQAFLAEHLITRVSVMGYSLGGRLALFCALQFSDRIGHLCLISPDGLVDRLWYRLATQHHAGRWAFKQIMHNPAPLLRASSLLHRLGLLNASLFRFVRQPLAQLAVRQSIYGSWLALSCLYRRGPGLAKRLQTAPYRITVFYGKFDRIIPHKRYQSFLKQIPKVQAVELEAGHNHLPARVGIWLAASLPK